MSPRTLENVRRIAVFRPNAVGDFVFSLPALRSLKNVYPKAELVYIGRSWHAEFLRDRPGPVDRVLVMPPSPGLGLPADQVVAPGPIDAFVAAARAEDFDMILQMYGGGHYSNPFCRKLGARLSAGLREEGAPALDRWLSYNALENRRLQLLEVAGLVGAGAWQPGPELCVTAADREGAERACPPLSAPLVLLQPGASDPRRRWPPESFAVVGDELAAEGACVAVHGTHSEAALVRAVRSSMRAPALDLAGKLSLSALCGLLSRTALVVSNDTGPLHLALAVGTPCVGIYWLTNLVESGPLRQSAHRAVLSRRTRCPVCGADNYRSRCAHNPSFVDDVLPDEVLTLCRQLLHHPVQWPPEVAPWRHPVAATESDRPPPAAAA